MTLATDIPRRGHSGIGEWSSRAAAILHRAGQAIMAPRRARASRSGRNWHLLNDHMLRDIGKDRVGAELEKVRRDWTMITGR